MDMDFNDNSANHGSNVIGGPTCIPIGEHTEVPMADLLQNAAVQYLLTKPNSKPRWCLRKAPHDIQACTFLHRTAEKAAEYVTVRGEPAPVSIADLLHNKGLEIAMANPDVFAEWCSVAAPHEVASCPNIHLGEVINDKTVIVEGEEAPVNVSHLLLNRGVSFLLASNGTARGVWCNNKIVHDVLGCPYIHRRIDDHPQVVNIEDEKFPIAVKDLVKNKGLDFLLENPQYSGRWCSLFTKHDPEDCGYLHRIHPFIRVDGDSVRVSDLRPNRGLKYVLEHPEAHGHWCRSKHDEVHTIDTCTFIHFKDETRQRRTEGRRRPDFAARDRNDRGDRPRREKERDESPEGRRPASYNDDHHHDGARNAGNNGPRGGDRGGRFNNEDRDGHRRGGNDRPPREERRERGGGEPRRGGGDRRDEFNGTPRRSHNDDRERGEYRRRDDSYDRPRRNDDRPSSSHHHDDRSYHRDRSPRSHRGGGEDRPRRDDRDRAAAAPSSYSRSDRGGDRHGRGDRDRVEPPAGGRRGSADNYHSGAPSSSFAHYRRSRSRDSYDDERREQRRDDRRADENRKRGTGRGDRGGGEERREHRGGDREHRGGEERRRERRD